jgi:hypothetical protein
MVMKVEGTIIIHPKYQRLKRVIGDRALEVLVRLWGHCEQGQKGEFWRGADESYLEAVAGWTGEPGKLAKALSVCGWVVKQPSGIRISNWARHNWRRVTNWQLGHRPKVSHRATNGKPEASQGSSTGTSPLTELTELTEVKTERERGAGAQVVESKLVWGVLNKRIKELERAKACGDFNAEDRVELRKKRAELRALEAKQQVGDFSV